MRLCKVYNQTKNVVLAEKAWLAEYPWEKMQGLLGKKGLSSGQGLVLPACHSIHTCFMGFPIDVIFIDNKGRIAILYEQMGPFQFSPVVWKAKAVIELPAGLLRSSQAEIGNFITIDNVQK
jgi:uncharacterized membrane protein (UPF0127 family)